MAVTVQKTPFVVLDEGPEWSVSGLCGRIWTLARDYPALSGADDFVSWAEPGTVRVLFARQMEGALRKLISSGKLASLSARARKKR